MATRTKKTPASDRTKDNSVCPFCALLCDDLSVKIHADGVSPIRLDCPNADNGFAQLIHEPSAPTLCESREQRPSEASLKDAISRAAAFLEQSEMPFIGGLGTDLDALRVLYKLGGQIGATMDPMSSDATLANIDVMQTLGWYTTTLSEVRNRSDVVLIVGADCRNKYGRFVERILEPAATLVPGARRARRVIYLGPRKNAPRSKKLRIENIYCADNEIATLLSVLRAHVLGKPLSTELTQTAKLADTAEALKSSNYANIVWSTSALDSNSARLCVESISKMVADLNATTRAAGLSLGGDDGGMSAMQVSSWLSGFPLRVSFNGGEPSYDPMRNSLNALVANGEVDCVVWVDAFGRSSPPELPSDIPLIFMGHPSLAKRVKADVCIPVGMPGIHHKARLVRTDSVVTVPMDRLYPSKLPSVKKIADALTDALTGEAP